MSITEFAHIIAQAAGPSGSRLQGPKGIKRLDKSLQLKDLILQRTETRDIHGRIILSTRIHKQGRKELRAWKVKQT